MHQETGALKNLVSSAYTDAQNEYNGILQQRELVDNLTSIVTNEMYEAQQNVKDAASIAATQIRGSQQGVEAQADQAKTTITRKESEVNETATNVTDAMSDAKQKVTNTVDGAIVSIGQKVKETEDIIDQKVNDAQTRMDAFVTETKTAATEAHTAVKNSKDAQIRAMQEELESLRKSFTQILDTARIEGEQATTAVTRRVNEVADQAKAVMIQAQQGVKDKANDLTKVGGVFAQAQQRITGATDNAQQTINDAKQRVTNTADGTIVSIEEDLEKLRNFLAQAQRDVTTGGDQATVTIKDTARKVQREIGQLEQGVETAVASATRAISAVQQGVEATANGSKAAIAENVKEITDQVNADFTTVKENASKAKLNIADVERKVREQEEATVKEARGVLELLKSLSMNLEYGNNGLQKQIAESEEMSAKIKEADRRLTEALEALSLALSQKENYEQFLKEVEINIPEIVKIIREREPMIQVKNKKSPHVNFSSEQEDEEIPADQKMKRSASDFSHTRKENFPANEGNERFTSASTPRKKEIGRSKVNSDPYFSFTPQQKATLGKHKCFLADVNSVEGASEFFRLLLNEYFNEDTTTEFYKLLNSTRGFLPFFRSKFSLALNTLKNDAKSRDILRHGNQ